MDFKEIFGSNRPRCQHFSEDGKRCSADPQKDKKFCFMHDPEQKEKQAEARKKGGESRSRPYEVKIPAGFDPGSLESLPELHQFIAQAVRYMLAGEMDQRSMRSCIYAANSIVAVLKEEARQQYRAHIVADKESRRLRRESNPWSPHFRASEKAAKAKEEAEKAEDKLPTEPNQEEVQHILVADAAAQSLRDLKKLQKEEEKKEKERERNRRSAGIQSAGIKTSEKTGVPGNVEEAKLQSDPTSQKAAQNEATSEVPRPPEPVVDYIAYGNSPFPAPRSCDTNLHATVTQYMLEMHRYPELRPKRRIDPVSFAFKGRRKRF